MQSCFFPTFQWKFQFSQKAAHKTFILHPNELLHAQLHQNRMAKMRET